MTDQANYTQIMSLITITNPSGSADQCAANTLQFRYADPDNNANLLTGTDFLKLIRWPPCRRQS